MMTFPREAASINQTVSVSTVKYTTLERFSNGTRRNGRSGLFFEY